VFQYSLQLLNNLKFNSVKYKKCFGKLVAKVKLQYGAKFESLFYLFVASLGGVCEYLCVCREICVSVSVSDSRTLSGLLIAPLTISIFAMWCAWSWQHVAGNYLLRYSRFIVRGTHKKLVKSSQKKFAKNKQSSCGSIRNILLGACRRFVSSRKFKHILKRIHKIGYLYLLTFKC